MNEEEILRRRLLFDGDGAGDEKKLIGLFRSWVRLCSSKYDSAQDMVVDAEMLKFQISQAELSMLKTHLVISMNGDEETAYNVLHGSIGKRIKELEDDIITAKKDLEESQVVRRQKMEYDAMAKLINKYPPRKEEEAKLAELRKQLDDSEAKLKDLDAKIELRTKQFHLLITALYQLESMLESEDPKQSLDFSESDRLDEISMDDSTELMEA